MNDLKTCAIALYWGEGAKSRRARVVDVANSDPAVIKVFLRYLREIEGVDETRLRVYLYCFSDQDVDSLIRFWSAELRIPAAQFTKPYVRSTDGRHRRRAPFGVVHIRYNDKRLLEKLLGEIESMRSWAGTEAVKRE